LNDPNTDVLHDGNVYSVIGFQYSTPGDICQELSSVLLAACRLRSQNADDGTTDAWLASLSKNHGTFAQKWLICLIHQAEYL
jgi:hypothetical protein